VTVDGKQKRRCFCAPVGPTEKLARGAENAGRETDEREIGGPICTLQGLKLQDVKMTDRMTGHVLLFHVLQF